MSRHIPASMWNQVALFWNLEPSVIINAERMWQKLGDHIRKKKVLLHPLIFSQLPCCEGTWLRWAPRYGSSGRCLELRSWAKCQTFWHVTPQIIPNPASSPQSSHEASVAMENRLLPQRLQSHCVFSKFQTHGSYEHNKKFMTVSYWELYYMQWITEREFISEKYMICVIDNFSIFVICNIHLQYLLLECVLTYFLFFIDLFYQF